MAKEHQDEAAFTAEGEGGAIGDFTDFIKAAVAEGIAEGLAAERKRREEEANLSPAARRAVEHCKRAAGVNPSIEGLQSLRAM